MNLFKALQDVPVGYRGAVHMKIIVTVIKNDGETYSMRLCTIDRVNNDIGFRIIDPGRLGPPERNFYWDRGGPGREGDFLQRCFLTSAKASKGVRESLLEISVRDPGRAGIR